jgi:radical SAM superfamily enzyme YgiQ (UPF0313 family)
MRIALLGPELEENLGLRYLEAALERAGHHVQILPFNSPADLGRNLRIVLRRAPDLIGYSLVAQRRFEDFADLTARLRSAGYRGHITAGGHFASLRAAEVLAIVPGIDSILHHDGEERITRLAAWLGEPGSPDPDSDPPEDLDGITWRARPGGGIRHRPARTVSDLAALPLPVRGRPHRTLNHAHAPIVASRGCSGSCSFCSIHAWHSQVPASGRLRLREPAAVAQEMIDLHRKHGVDVFVFHDDDFLPQGRHRALDRCRRIFDTAEGGMGRPFAFVIKCRPDDVDTEVFRYLKEKGLARVYVGIETHSRLGLKTLHRRVDPDTNLRALSTLRALGVYACFNLLLFHPESTIEELEENLRFLDDHIDLPFDVARTELYARSPLETRMLREGRAIGDFRGYDYRIADARVETVFRLFARALWGRQFGNASILHRTQDLGNQASLLRRLHPRLVSGDLQRRVDGLIRDVNADTIEHVRALVRLARERGFSAESVRDPALASLERAIVERARQRGNTWRILLLELGLRARVDRGMLARAAAVRAVPDWIGRAAAAFPFLGIALAALSCSDGPGICDPPPPPHQFSRDIEPRLVETCAVPGCHAGAAPQAGLDLSAGEGRGNLVDVPSTELPSMDRVEPGEPDSSYVVHKLLGTQGEVGGQGVRMPKGRQPDDSLTGRMEQWIATGADDD